LPPNLKKDIERLRNLLDLLPVNTRAAFEFRNDSWQDEEVYSVLRARGAMLCVADTDEGDTPYVTTCERGYIRLRRTHYAESDLRAWSQRIADQGSVLTYVYFMHEDEALGTRFAQQLLALWPAQGGR
jgi:uncharacterized protein YecE (DUF72 family)